jgi:hypothetical protein
LSIPVSYLNKEFMTEMGGENFIASISSELGLDANGIAGLAHKAKWHNVASAWMRWSDPGSNCRN